jgi:uncharacterized protein YjbI with pentapeptide repeats
MNHGNSIGNGKDKKLIDKLKKSDKHSGSELSGQILFNLDLSYKDFSKSDLSGANLTGTNLSFCDLTSTDLTDTNLEGSHLRNTKLDGAKRAGKQILKYASITVGDKYYYGFLCKGEYGQTVLINEPGKKEYEFKRGNASQMGAILYNFLVNE